ncbi:MAG TPA: SUMF1/EgtB/PvdO family nonheme iron enzyme [Polyangiaceae bacterium]|nr:SUMF1/EgtB/PvdO family nonheme iron enzyme [Polyangiaceae bacterium]
MVEITWATRLPLMALFATACSHMPSAGARASAEATLGASAPPTATAAVPSRNAVATSNPLAVRDQADCPEGMLFIPEGDLSFIAQVPGKRDQSPQPQFFHIQAFCIDRTEVPTSKWNKETCGKQDSECMSGTSRIGPAACVSQAQAECYCENVLPGNKARLPTDPEWLFAALGSDGRKFPWGNTPYPDDLGSRTPDFCAIESRMPYEPCRVDGNTRDKGPFGVIGMGTNGFEMTATCLTLEAAPTAGQYCVSRGLNHSTDVFPLAQFPGLEDRETRHIGASLSFRCATSQRAQL